MSSIGSLSVMAMRGTVQGDRRPVQTITRAGVDGLGLLVGNYQTPTSTLETDFYGTFSEVSTWIADAEVMVGTVVSMTDPHATVWANTAILDVECTIIRAAALGGSNTHIVRASWLVACDEPAV